MARLIDADTLFKSGAILIPTKYYEGARIVIDAIRNAPTVEVEPIEVRAAYEQKAYNKGYADGIADSVKHGHWIYDERNGNYYCSECHRRGGVYIDGDDGIELLGNYCGICGARMMDEVGK